MSIYEKDFKPRTTAPSSTNKWYIKTSYGGFDKAALINKKDGSCLPNCVGLVHGRFLECAGIKDYSKDKLCTGNAKSYYGYTKDGYLRGKTPRVGAIACWSGGTYGHVGFVERVNSDGSIYCSMSDWVDKKRWYYRTIKKVNGSYSYNSLKFQGFIYNPWIIVPIGKATVKTTGLRIRKSYSTKSSIVGTAKLNTTYLVYEVKKNQGYTWYRIGTDKWIANNGKWVTYKKI